MVDADPALLNFQGACRMLRNLSCSCVCARDTRGHGTQSLAHISSLELSNNCTIFYETTDSERPIWSCSDS